MLNFITTTLKDRILSFLPLGSKREIFVTYLYLCLVQGANYLLPLVTVPYIARAIAPESFGKITVAQAFIAYFTLIVNYGFDFTSTREIASNSDDKKKVQEVLNSTYSAKVLLLIGSTLVFTVATLFLSDKEDLALYWVTYLVNLGHFLTPTWFLQGIGKLRLLAIFNLSVKLLFTLFIFYFVSSDEDTFFIPLSTSISQIILGLIGVAWLIKRYQYTFWFSSLPAVLQVLKKGASISMSTLTIHFYTTSNILLIGFLGDEISTASFSASSKLVTIIASAIMAPIGLTLFPILAKKMNSSVQEGILTIHRLALLLGGVTSIISAILYFFAPFIIDLFYGDQYPETYKCLQIVAFIPMLVTINNIYGTQGILNLKMDKVFMTITLAGSVLSIVLNFLLIPSFEEYGTASAWVITEIFITLCFFLLFRHKSRTLFKAEA